MLKVPFYENTDDDQCMQVAMKCVLKYFLNKEFDLDYLDELTGRKNGKWTWTVQIVSVLYDLGLDVKYYSKIDFIRFLEGGDFIRNYYGSDADKIISKTNLPSLFASISKLEKSDLFEKRKLDFWEIESEIAKNHVPLMLFDWNKLNKIQGNYQGHFVVVTGYDSEYVFYHESGPKDAIPNRGVPKKDFIGAWNANGTDNDIVIVYGRRKKFCNNVLSSNNI